MSLGIVWLTQLGQSIKQCISSVYTFEYGLNTVGTLSYFKLIKSVFASLSSIL